MGTCIKCRTRHITLVQDFLYQVIHLLILLKHNSFGRLQLVPGVITVVALRGRAVSTTAPTAGQVLKWNGVSNIWEPSSSLNYNAGPGITIFGSTISHTSHIGDITGITAITVTGLQGKKSFYKCSKYWRGFKWNGSAWEACY